MDLLKEIVRINESGLVADAVNLGMLDDQAKNLSLCQGFVFNYSHEAPKSSTVGVLECIRRSFHSPSEPNVHLVVQDYGKGKSHFALVTANYFYREHDSLEVTGILNQIEVAVGGKRAVLEDLRAHKERTRPYLVLAISGERQADLKQMLLREIRNRLSSDGITDSIAQQLCQRPLAYLRGLDNEGIGKANEFLKQKNVDVASLIKLLEADGYQEIATVRDLSRELTGYPIDFDADLGLEQILQDLLRKLCTGPGSQYQGILILFDELNVYLQSWASNPGAAGGMALQNLTNICENNKGRIAFVNFTQIKPSHAAALPANSAFVKDYKKLTSRIELAPSTYEPMSSLELVLDNLINPQNRTKWQEFMKTWRGSFQAECDNVFPRCAVYQQRRWPQTEFFEHLVVGSFPLHPLTAYLLCNLDFMQGRTAIQFVKENVRNFIESEPANKNGFLNFVRPVALVEAFQSNLSNHSSFADYLKAQSKISASATADDLRVLDALFLFYVSGAKLKKSDKEPHEQILSIICGMTPDKTREHLIRLSEQLGVIYLFSGTNTYRFYAGAGLDDLRRAIEEEVSETSDSQEALAAYLQENISKYSPPYVEATRFVTEQRLNAQDWKFSIRVYTPDRIQELLERAVVDNNSRGLVAYVVSSTSNEVQLRAIEFEEYLRESPLKAKVVIAQPARGLGNIGELILKLRVLKSKSSAERDRYGEAYSQLLRMWEHEVDNGLENSFNDILVCSSIADRLPTSERNSLDAVCSLLLSDRYGFVPPVERVDKLISTNRAGAQIVSLMLKHLLTRTLTTQSFPTTAYRTVIDSVFLRTWRLLALTGTHYAPQVPTNARIKAAWDALDLVLPLERDGEKRIAFSEIWKLLSSEPFGYGELTLTALMGAWISVNRPELYVDQVRRSPGRPSIHQELAIGQFFQSAEMEVPAKLVSSWQREDLFLIRRPAVTDVSVPPRLSIDDGKAVLIKIQEFLSGEPSNVTRATDLRNAAKVIKFEIDQIEKWEEQCRSDFSQIDSADLAHIVGTFGLLQSAPNYAGKRFEVYLTEPQISSRLARIEKARSFIQLRVAETERKAGSIATDEDFRAIASQIERDQEILRRDEALSRTFSDQLEAARRTAESRFESLSRQTRFEQTLRNVKNVIGALSQATTQTALANAKHAIEHYAEECPEIVSNREYRSALGHIETYQLNQKSWLAECKSRADLVKSKRESETLLAEIRGNTERFDTAEDTAQLSAISAMLADAAQRFERIERAEGILNSFLSTLRGASQRVLRAKDAAGSLTEYRELANCECGNVEEARTKSQVLEVCEKIKRDVIESVNQRVRAVCNETPTTLNDCGRLLRSLQSIREELTDLDEFGLLQPLVTESISNIEVLKANLELNASDEQTMVQIIEVGNSRPTTLAQCESSKARIRELAEKLHSPDPRAKEVESAVGAVRKCEELLLSRLTAIKTAISDVKDRNEFDSLQRSYDQLQIVFAGSRCEQDYQKLDGEITALRQVFNRIGELEMQASKPDSVAAWHASLNSFESAIGELPTWAAAHVQPLCARMRTKIENAELQLQSWEDQLENGGTAQSLSKVRAVIGSKAGIYVDSELFPRYELINSASEAVTACVELESFVNAITTEALGNEALVKLADLKSRFDGAAVLVTRRMDAINESIEAKIRIAQEKTRRDWSSWSETITNKMRQLSTESNKLDRLPLVNSLLREIRAKLSTASTSIPSSSIESAREIEAELVALANADRADRIVSLFIELPVEEQMSLIQRLADFARDRQPDLTLSAEQRSN